VPSASGNAMRKTEPPSSSRSPVFNRNVSDGRLRLQDFQSAATREHQIEEHQVEYLGIDATKPIFTGPGHDAS
jgi:hypothetical protein